MTYDVYCGTCFDGREEKTCTHGLLDHIVCRVCHAVRYPGDPPYHCLGHASVASKGRIFVDGKDIGPITGYSCAPMFADRPVYNVYTFTATADIAHADYLKLHKCLAYIGAPRSKAKKDFRREERRVRRYYKRDAGRHDRGHWHAFVAGHVGEVRRGRAPG